MEDRYEHELHCSKDVDRLLREFDKVSKHFQKALEPETSSMQIIQIVQESRAEYIRLIPDLPNIGGSKNPFYYNLIGSAWLLALFKTLENFGFELREIGRIGYATFENYIDSYSSLTKFFFRTFMYSRFTKKRMQESAKKSQEHEYQDDWVYSFVEGVDGDFEWGVDFTECAIYKFYKKQGAERFLPYICLGDYAMYSSFGVGMKRSKTLGSGHSHCDFRYVKGYKTPRGWPPEDLEEFQIMDI
ncbi:MAG: L-2-amino-thiazoline-4-carboxylic acid hydrolase [Candidatus Thorarchaeota archaeon SMTZ1-45]|nr:MAG: hypothetical protein AM325_08690 [Candidatus Thorarchaeota archaeon SMTZ1-45]